MSLLRSEANIGEGGVPKLLPLLRPLLRFRLLMPIAERTMASMSKKATKGNVDEIGMRVNEALCFTVRRNSVVQARRRSLL